MIFKLEIIGFNIESCIIAQAAGAHRIELCDNPGEGGTTPSYGFIKKAREVLQIELYCMIRPRGGDFFYTDEEFDIMKTDVQTCKQLGCDGVVIGMLNQDGTVDKERCKKLVELAYPMGVTYQRANILNIQPISISTYVWHIIITFLFHYLTFILHFLFTNFLHSFIIIC